MIRIAEYLTYIGIPYEYLNAPLTLQVIEDKAYELSRYRKEANYSGDVQIKAPPSLLMPVVAELFDKYGLSKPPSININEGFRYQFMHFSLWAPPQPAMCTMLLEADRIGHTIMNPKCHFVYLNCRPQNPIDYQI